MKATVRDAARRYRSNGLSVVPNAARDKRPYHAGWQERIFTEADFNLNDNIGIETGAPSGNVVCVDIDSEVGRQLASVFLPSTPVVCGRGKSPTGHRFYRVDRDIPGRKWELADAHKKQFGFAHTVELLATGQQVVVGPSVHSTGDIYHDLIGDPALVTVDELVAACAALDQAVRLKLGIVEIPPESNRERKQHAARPVEGTREQKLKRAAAYLAQIPPAISGQGGHKHTFITAMKLVSFGLSPDDVFDLLSGWNQSCEPKWSDKELWHKIDGAFDAEPDPMEDRPRNSTHGVNLDAIMGEKGTETGNFVYSVDFVYGVEDWPEPVPLSSAKGARFPIGAIPEAVRGYLEQLAEFSQTPIDLAAGMWLAATGVCLQKTFAVQPVRGWVESLNLYVLAAMEPANRKSAVVSAIAAPLRNFEAAELERMGPAIRAAKSAAEIKLKQRTKLVDDAAKAAFGNDREMLLREVQSLDEEIAANPVPSEPRLLCDDITPEHLATKMVQNGGRMGVLTAEGDLFDIMAGRYSARGAANIGIFLKSHSGDQVKVDRGNRPSELIESPALSLGFCVQPEVLRGLMGQKQFRGRGLMGRLLYQIPESTLGRRKITPEEIDPMQEVGYENLMRSLLELSRGQTDKCRLICLSNSALQLFTNYRELVEQSLGEFGELGTISDWAGKLPGAVARIAGLFHVVEHAYSPEIPRDISGDTMQAAITVGEYFTSHAVAAFAIMGRDESTAMAEHILAAIQKHEWHQFNRHQLYQVVRRRVNSPEDLDSPLKKLIENGYVRVIPQAKQGPGRKPSELYESHPRLAGVQF